MKIMSEQLIIESRFEAGSSRGRNINHSTATLINVKIQEGRKSKQSEETYKAILTDTIRRFPLCSQIHTLER
jgi:hypothetical protein